MTDCDGTFNIFGMSRSGTTLTARMLDTHEEIVCGVDAYHPFFKYLRRDIAAEAGLDSNVPLGSYFGDADELALFQAVEDGSLDRPFPQDETGRLLNYVHAENEKSPKINDCLDSIHGETFAEVYDHLLSHVSEAYGSGDEQWRAIKDVYTTEFVPALARTYPDMRFVLIVRDPRAVCASNNVQDVKYPWLLLSRQWRGIAGMSSRYAEGQPFSDRVTIVRYEDLVTTPRETAERLCSFLDIDLDERILDLSEFEDGSGDQWLQNTAHGEYKVDFNTDSIDKWKSTLDDEVVRYIEQLCLPEMRRFGYEPREATSPGIDDDLLLDPPMVPFEDLDDWIRPHVEDRSQLSLQQEVAVERIRYRLLLASERRLEGIDEQTLAAYFQDTAHFETLRSLTNADADI